MSGLIALAEPAISTSKIGCQPYQLNSIANEMTTKELTTEPTVHMAYMYYMYCTVWFVDLLHRLKHVENARENKSQGS
jgi:hypothetical protein